MTKILKKFEHFLNEKKWSGDVEAKWSPKEGIFTQSGKKIAKYLKAESDSLKQAMSRLNYYINRAGSNLGSADKARLEKAKEKLHKLYNKEEK